MDLNYKTVNLFPVPVHQFDVNGFSEIKDKLIDYAYDCKKKDSKGVSISNRGGWQSEGFEIINLLLKVEKLETWIQNIEQEMTDVQTEISEIDDKGYFESDDEVGEKFNQISQVIKNIQTLRGEDATNDTTE